MTSTSGKFTYCYRKRRGLTVGYFLKKNVQIGGGVLETNITYSDGNIGQKHWIYHLCLSDRIFGTTEPFLMFLYGIVISFASSATQASLKVLSYGRNIFLAMKLREIEKYPPSQRGTPYQWFRIDADIVSFFFNASFLRLFFYKGTFFRWFCV